VRATHRNLADPTTSAYARPMPAARKLRTVTAGALALLALPGVARAQVIALPPPIGPRPQPQPQPQPSPPPSRPSNPSPPPPSGSLSLSVSRYDIVYGHELNVSGHFTASSGSSEGREVKIEVQVPRQYPQLDGHYGPLTTDRSGRFGFSPYLRANVRFSAFLADAPSVRSAPRRVYVFPEEFVNVTDQQDGRRVHLEFTARGAGPQAVPGARYAYFYFRRSGKRTFRRVARARVISCCGGGAYGWVVASKTVSVRLLTGRGFVTACTKTTPIAGMGRGYDARCGRRTFAA
jgi:hypothetical protein